MGLCDMIFYFQNEITWIEFLTLKVNPTGQTLCPNPKCYAKYNNKYVPPNCYSCGSFLGGSYKKVDKTDEDTKMLTSTLCSVRLGVRGVAKRVFVDLSKEKVNICLKPKHSILYLVPTRTPDYSFFLMGSLFYFTFLTTCSDYLFQPLLLIIMSRLVFSGQTSGLTSVSARLTYSIVFHRVCLWGIVKKHHRQGYQSAFQKIWP